jgi:hypothetical protein
MKTKRTKAKRTRTANTIDSRLLSTRFDLLGGAYQKARTLRLTLLVLVGAILVGLAFVIADGLRMNLESRQLAQATEQAQIDYENLNRSLAAGLPVNVSERQLLTLIERRAGAHSVAVAQPDLQRVLADLRQAAQGVGTISQVQLTPTSTRGEFELKVEVSSASLPAQAAWIDRVGALSYLRDARTTTAGSGEAGRITTTAKVVGLESDLARQLRPANGG